MAIFANCYIALGVDAVGGTLTELSGGSYVRQALNLGGGWLGGTSQTFSAFGAAAAPTGQLIRAAAVFDALTGGNQLCYFNFHRFPYASTMAYPAATFNFTMIGWIAADANVMKATIPAGAQIGTVNGNPLLANRSLWIAGGVFTTIDQHSVSTLNGLASTSSFANDTLAATGGVPLNLIYRNGNIVQIRVV